MSERDLADLPVYLRREIEDIEATCFDMNWERY